MDSWIPGTQHSLWFLGAKSWGVWTAYNLASLIRLSSATRDRRLWNVIRLVPESKMGMQNIPLLSHQPSFSLLSKLVLSCQTKTTKKAMCSGLVKLRWIASLQNLDQPAKCCHVFPRAMGSLSLVTRQTRRERQFSLRGRWALSHQGLDAATFNSTFKRPTFKPLSPLEGQDGDEIAAWWLCCWFKNWS